MFDISVNFLENLLRKQKTLLIGIDGCGGAGKSALAKQIRRNLPDAAIVEMDDFYFRNGFDWQRLKRQVLEPLSLNIAAKYQRYDWQTEKLAEWRKIEVGGTVIIEGIYSTRTELADFYDYKIWIECPREIRLARGIERDGEAMRGKWENEWMPDEDFYAITDNPKQRADLIVKSY